MVYYWITRPLLGRANSLPSHNIRLVSSRRVMAKDLLTMSTLLNAVIRWFLVTALRAESWSSWSR